ncbi:MAG: hypothetical protein H6937_10610, partial [Burkholderiales bacterium]|nr:hypothetical protein [Burkholderiales bacterium]
MMLKTRIGLITLGIFCLILISACSTTQNKTHSSRTAIEQLLHSEAVSKSLTQQTRGDLPMPPGSKVAVTTAGLSLDNPFVGDVIGGWLGSQGFYIESPENAQYRVHIV